MQINIKVSMALFVLCTGFVQAHSALAGTTQIYSPAGLPRSSGQDYSIPGTTIPTQTFSTPPIPLVDIGVQNFSNIPLKSEINTNLDKLKRQGIQQNNLQPVSENNDVGSLFQLAPVSANQGTKAANGNKSTVGPAGRVIWHVLDNLGVPMFIGKDSDLDPSLRINVPTHPENIPSKSNMSSIHQKIPDSELEGTDIPIRDNAKP